MTAPTMTPAGWYIDPSRRHEYRYWDGKDWTPQVSDRGLIASDPELRPPASPNSALTAHPLATPAPAPDRYGLWARTGWMDRVSCSTSPAKMANVSPTWPSSARAASTPAG